MLYMDWICIRISQCHLDTVPAQPSGTVLAIAVEQQCTLKRCIWSESAGLDMESSSWEMAPWLQLIMTSPGAFTHQPEFGSRAVAESALNSASWKMLLERWGGLIWTPAGHSYLREINCKIVTLSFEIERSRQRFNCQAALAVALTRGGFACCSAVGCQKWEL